MAIYMKLGSVVGNATHSKYKNWITLQNMSWHILAKVGTNVGDAANRMSAGKITPAEFTLHKEFDMATVPLMLLAFAGQPVGQCEIAVTQQASTTGEAYLRYILTGTIISAYEIGVSHEGNPQDLIKLNITGIEVVAQTVDELGMNLAPVRGSYNFGQASGSQIA